jgi:hypothetical protein
MLRITPPLKSDGAALVVRPLNSITCNVIEFILTTSPELVFHSAGVKKRIGRKSSGFRRRALPGGGETDTDNS